MDAKQILEQCIKEEERYQFSSFSRADTLKLGMLRSKAATVDMLHQSSLISGPRCRYPARARSGCGFPCRSAVSTAAASH